ncbi:MAG: hypothetical protein U0169_18665 [Polyangiaceae bacterium]
MLPVHVTVRMGSKTLALADVRDRRIHDGLAEAGRDIGRKLALVKCAEHGKTATAIRLHFEASGAADLKYDSCCAGLGAQIQKALG